MYIHQFYTNCLAQAAYYIESDREAAIIDPLRDPGPYLELAKMRGATIRYIMETHFHADFVSGHLDLAAATKGEIIFGPHAQPSYPAHISTDGEIFQLGKIKIKVLHTPGHTIESCCFLACDENDEENVLFSGDTLFDGDVGRPDLLSGNLNAKTLAGMLYESLKNKIKPLADSIIVYPGHGPGSACGKNIGKDTVTTIGKQRQANYAMKDISKEMFVALVTSGQSAPPFYFFSDAAMNKTGYLKFDDVLRQSLHFLSPGETDRMKQEGSILLDSRSSGAFADRHIPGSVNIGLNGDFASWVGTLFLVTTSFVLITDPGAEKETATRLARIGCDNVRGVLKGGIEAWKLSGRPLGTITSVNTGQLEKILSDKKNVLLDVRRPLEAEHCRLENAMFIPLNQLPQKIGQLDVSAPYYVMCAGGYRSMIAASLLKAAGIETVYNVTGGINRVRQENPNLFKEFAV
jgi:hydroxyacylglutathione hydrolase